MLSKKYRTMERYKKAGAKMRLFKTLGVKMITEISSVLSAADRYKLMCAMDKVDEICSKAEDNMFRDYPQLTGEYIDVFYGATDYEPRNDVDREIIEMAREAADELFTRKRN